MTFPEPLKEVVLERLQVAAQQRLSASLAHSLTAEFAEYFADDLVLRLRSFVLAENVGKLEAAETETVALEYPASPWQHWKFNRQNRPRWWWFWVRWLPEVRYRRQETDVTVVARWTAYHTFPESSIVVPNERLGRPYRFAQLDSASVSSRWRRDLEQQ